MITPRSRNAIVRANFEAMTAETDRLRAIVAADGQSWAVLRRMTDAAKAHLHWEIQNSGGDDNEQALRDAVDEADALLRVKDAAS